MNRAVADLDSGLAAAYSRIRGKAPQALPLAERDFLAQVDADWAVEDAPILSATAAAQSLVEFWDYASASNSEEALVRLRPSTAPLGTASDRDLLEIVQTDRPFILDSVMGEITEAGFRVRAMFHPVVELHGVPRSLIQVHLEPVGEDRVDMLLNQVRETLADVRRAVSDFHAMRELMHRAIGELAATPGVTTEEGRQEDIAFLRWLENDNFVFLGARVYDYPRTAQGAYAAEEPLYEAEASLGVLRDPTRAVLRRANEPALLSTQLARQLEAGHPVVVAKSNLRSRVHRRGFMDYVGVRRYGADGKPSGEIRFVGLFTAEAYETPAHQVPLIRRRVSRIMRRAAKSPGSHNEKRLRNILETWPRDELFQTPEESLLPMALGVLHLIDRPRVRLFARMDPFDRFASVLVYIPRERFDTEVCERAGAILADAYDGRVLEYYPEISDAPLARAHFIIEVMPGDHPDPDLTAVEARIADTTLTWDDRFEAVVRAGGAPTGGVRALLARYGGAFPPGYRDQYDPAEALADIAIIERIEPGRPPLVRAFRRPEDDARTFRFKLYLRDAAAPIAEVLPILERMGLKALIEDGHRLTLMEADGPHPVWIHEFVLDDPAGEQLDFEDVRRPFEEAFIAVWTGKAENDGFNRLVLELGVSWREAALVRALARYRQQSGMDPSQQVQEAALCDHPGVTRLILDLFRVKFDPAIAVDIKARRAQGEAVQFAIAEALLGVESLDADRVLSRLAALVGAIKRTNFYQLGDDGEPKPYVSFKVASGELADLPAPKPFREIFVSATHVEGVHLRFGPVARGGLRWSDRRDDFRTEVLGLVKAQQVKNAVIVPVGSKGGFYPKQLPRGGSPDAIRAEGVRAYTTFLSGLLDITDNLSPDGQVIRPAGVIAYDGDDPYLVVAADKGTATFSDIANGIAESYGFWLGDAFASGGSAGYDHKVMGITARGAWEAVKRHFRELGKDIQSEPFTVVGVGDMSGDVFGNGMLLSRQTRLLAAFDHRHIFLDPNPDTEAAYAERERMFALPRSSWDDYDRERISAGGGVFPRTQKSIPLTAEVREMLGVAAEAMAPAELMTAILKAPAELLYLGGIGTYVKAAREANSEVGDKANDAIRVDARELRVRVVGEGANLGLTQAGRIEFASAGGRINTDAIDNSAGVDSSDHEVNIKIATGMLERTGVLNRPKRDKLLKSMTDEVAAHVLAHNYDQTLALSLLDAEAVPGLEPHARFMARLEAAGRLDRTVEGLPGPAEIAERAAAGRGLTRPEEAVLLAYGKLEFSHEIVASTAPDDPWFEQLLEGYFPKPLRKYADTLKRHRLRREIIATVIANDVVNRCGPSFPSRLMAAAACDARALTAGWEAAKTVLDLAAIWSAVAALDNKVPATAQVALFHRLASAQRGQTFWLARRAQRGGQLVDDLIRRYAPGAAALRKQGQAFLTPLEQARVAAEVTALTEAGAPAELAAKVAILQPLTISADLVDLAEASSWDLPNVARLYGAVGARFAFDRLRDAAGQVVAGDSFERTAVRRLIEDLLAEQAQVTRAIMAFSGSPDAGSDADKAAAAVSSWAALRRGTVEAAAGTLADIEGTGGAWTFAKLTIANAALRELSAEAR